MKYFSEVSTLEVIASAVGLLAIFFLGFFVYSL